MQREASEGEALSSDAECEDKMRGSWQFGGVEATLVS